MEQSSRKLPRHPEYDYNTPGYYFITFCTKDRAHLLGEIVGRSLPDAPPEHTPLRQKEHPGGCSLQAHMQYSAYGEITWKQLEKMTAYYPDIILEKYVIMPNHIHLLLRIPGILEQNQSDDQRKNNCVSKFIGTFKRFCNRQYGCNIWQTSFHDHIIRGKADYEKIWMYIETHPLRWENDCFY